MRIGDNPSLYSLTSRQEVPKRAPDSLQGNQQPLLLPAPASFSAKVDPASNVQKQQLLQNYLQQPQSPSGSGLQQQRALAAYDQFERQAQQDKLHTMLGVDEYV